MDEAQLIAAARVGDQDAFAELYREHHRYVRAIGRSILQTDDLDDMCQETFLSAFMGLQTFEGNSRFRTWISRIALNQGLMILRRQRRLGPHDDQLLNTKESVEPSMVSYCDPSLDGVAQKLDLEKLLGHLTPVQREALRLAYVEEMEAPDIATALKTTVAAIKGRLAVAKKKLKMIAKE